MTRSQWKGKHISASLMNIISKDNLSIVLKEKNEFHTKERDCVFVKPLIGKVVNIYNGKDWFRLVVSSDMLYQQFGKYSWSKKRCVYKSKSKKKKKK
uniref:Ribosomal protein S19 n=1 Tax=Stachyamoeba lipophora TaxID=463046 RepID=A0A0B5GMZ7_STALP|nr:ribosomal protein S19 [Stachyamoeba lipophora]AJF22933.1 ribosomal protein S19 [Stachyamoeba lipophora]